MHHISFGDVLKEARLAKGMDIASVSQTLRIRQDIIRAIENSDFSRMPSRGYARNMVIAYARLVGLNPQDVSRMYLDQEYAYQIERAHREVGNTIQMHRDTASIGRSSQQGTSSFERVDSATTSSRRRSRQDAGTTRATGGAVSSTGRRLYSQNDDMPATGANAPVAHRARRSAMPDGKYTNLYSAPRNIPNPNRNRNIIIGAVAAVLVIVIIALAVFFTHRSEPQTNIPVTGATGTAQEQGDSTQQSTDETTTTTQATPPSEMTFTYSVASGKETYIEVYVDDKLQEADDVSGPAEKSYTSSGTIRFVSSETSGVSATLDDEKVKLTTGSSGIVNQTFKFSDVLDQWYKDHPDVKRTDSSSSKSSDKTSSSDKASSSDSSSSSSSSSKKSSSDSDDKGSSE